MRDDTGLTDRFEAARPRMRAVARRILGNGADAEDAVQEAWLRLSRADVADILNLDGWFTTVVARICLDMLRARGARRETSWDERPAPDSAAERSADDDVLLADSVGAALMLVLERLSPLERIAFVLHDMFDVPFEDVAAVLGRSPAAARQLASRARRRVAHTGAAAEADSPSTDVVRAFLEASRAGDFAALIALLDPDVTVRADAAAIAMGAAAEVNGPHDVAATFAGRARGAVPALLDGAPGLLWAPGGAPRVAFRFGFSAAGAIVSIRLIADPVSLTAMRIERQRRRPG